MSVKKQFEKEGHYLGHPWFWYTDFGSYVCDTLPINNSPSDAPRKRKALSADTLEELQSMISKEVDKILAKRKITLKQYLKGRW